MAELESTVPAARPPTAAGDQVADRLGALRPGGTVDARLMFASMTRRLFQREVDELRLGRFEARRKLGEGAMGIVYEAYDPHLDRLVAIKLLRVDAASGHRAADRLEREAKAMARLRHANVLTVYDVGEAFGRLFIAMELATGGTLRDWLSDKRRELPEIVDKFVQCGAGLAAAHAEGFVHRDFKPENVFVQADGSVRVGDFGLVYEPEDAELGETVAPAQELGTHEISTQGGLTGTGTVVGTPSYMAPEQWAGGAIDARADQYSFCVTLYEALYGARPHARKPVIDAEPPAESQDARIHVPDWLREVLRRGLRLDPSQRYESMASLVADLERGSRTTLLGMPATGRSVSCAVLAGFFREAAQKGVDGELLAEGLPYDLEHLMTRSADIDWASFAKFMGNVARRLGATSDAAPPIQAGTRKILPSRPLVVEASRSFASLSESPGVGLAVLHNLLVVVVRGPFSAAPVLAALERWAPRDGVREGLVVVHEPPSVMSEGRELLLSILEQAGKRVAFVGEVVTGAPERAALERAAMKALASAGPLPEVRVFGAPDTLATWLLPRTLPDEGRIELHDLGAAIEAIRRYTRVVATAPRR